MHYKVRMSNKHKRSKSQLSILISSTITRTVNSGPLGFLIYFHKLMNFVHCKEFKSKAQCKHGPDTYRRFHGQKRICVEIKVSARKFQAISQVM